MEDILEIYIKELQSFKITRGQESRIFLAHLETMKDRCAKLDQKIQLVFTERKLDVQESIRALKRLCRLEINAVCSDIHEREFIQANWMRVFRLLKSEPQPIIMRSTFPMANVCKLKRTIAECCLRAETEIEDLFCPQIRERFCETIVEISKTIIIDENGNEEAVADLYTAINISINSMDFKPSFAVDLSGILNEISINFDSETTRIDDFEVRFEKLKSDSCLIVEDVFEKELLNCLDVFDSMRAEISTQIKLHLVQNSIVQNLKHNSKEFLNTVLVEMMD